MTMRVKARADLKDRITDGRVNQGIHALEEYFVIEVDQSSYRVINDNGEPILYAKPLFEVIDGHIPPGWELREYEDGEYFLNPIGTSARGFYEAFFFSSGDKDAWSKTRRVVVEVLSAMKEAGSSEERALIERDLQRLAANSSAPW
jgi:hypothetical protein